MGRLSALLGVASFERELTDEKNSFVETKGRTLEEINDIFDAPYPMKRSIKKHIVVVTRDRVVLGKDSDEYS